MKSSNPQIATITGAGRGSGKATALKLGRSGKSLYITDIDSNLLEESLSDLKSEGIEATGGVFDSSDISNSKILIDSVIEHYGKLDILINNAGASKPNSFPEVSEENWEWNLNLNLKGPFFIMQEAAKHMIKQK